MPFNLAPHGCSSIGLKSVKKRISWGRTVFCACVSTKPSCWWDRLTFIRCMASVAENGPTPVTNGPVNMDKGLSLENLELAQVQVVFRHGARTPNSWGKEKFNDFSTLKPHVWDKSLADDLPGPSIPYKVTLPDGECPERPMYDDCVGVEVLGGCRTGQLTTVGRQQLRDLGKRLSAEYITKKQFISATYNPQEVYLRSTYFQRTTQSLVNLLTGMYRDETSTGTVQIETKDEKLEDLYPNLSHCSNFIKWTNQFYSLANTKPEVTAFEHHINGLMGLRDGCERVWASRLGDLIRCRRTHGFSVPQYLLDNEPTINSIELDTCQNWFGKGNIPIARLCIGSFMNTLCERTSDCVSGSSTHKMFMYSGHDWTVLPLLIVLGVDIEEWPPFASNLIFELYQHTGDQSLWFLRVVYNGEVLVLDKESGQEFTPVEKFMDMVEIYRVSDIVKEWGSEC